MTTAEPSTVAIPCPGGCGGQIELSYDKIRELVDTDKQPKPCVNCRAEARRRSRSISLKGPLRRKMDAVLIAMLRLEEDLGAGRAFYQSAIVTEAWLVEDGYSLPFYEGTYPDSHRVLMDITKLLKTGFIAKPEPCHYALTEMGRARARLFCHEKPVAKIA